VQEIAASSSEQSSSVEQIGGAMGQLNKATQQNASASEELAATSEELSAQADQLKQSIDFSPLTNRSGNGQGCRYPCRVAGASRRVTVGTARSFGLAPVSIY